MRDRFETPADAGEAVARLVEAARAPGTADELARRETVLAAYDSMMAGGPAPVADPEPPARRRRVGIFAGLTTATVAGKLIVGAAVAVAAGGAAFVAVDTVSHPHHPAPAPVTSAPAIGTGHHGPGHSTPPSRRTVAGSSSTAISSGASSTPGRPGHPRPTPGTPGVPIGPVGPGSTSPGFPGAPAPTPPSSPASPPSTPGASGTAPHGKAKGQGNSQGNGAGHSTGPGHGKASGNGASHGNGGVGNGNGKGNAKHSPSPSAPAASETAVAGPPVPTSAQPSATSSKHHGKPTTKPDATRV